MSTHVYRLDNGGASGRSVILVKDDGDDDYFPANSPEVSPIILLTGTGQAGPDLLAIEALTGINVIYYRSDVNTWSPVIIGSGISFSGGILSNTLTGTLDPDLQSLANATGTAIYYRTGDSGWSPVVIGSGLSFNNGILISSGITDGDLTAIAALTGVNTLYYRSGTDTWSPISFSGLTFDNGLLSTNSIAALDGLTGINVLHYRPFQNQWTDVKYQYYTGGGLPLDAYLETQGVLSGHLLTRSLFDEVNNQFLNYNNGVFILFTDSGTFAGPSGIFALNILNGGTSANSATQARINLGLRIGVDVQAWDADLDSLSDTHISKTLYYKNTGSKWAPVLPTGKFNHDYRTVLLATGGGNWIAPAHYSGHLVTRATYDTYLDKFFALSNSGFELTDYTGGNAERFIVPLSHGGTSATGASGARANLGLIIGQNIQGWDSDLQSLSSVTTNNTIYYRSGEGVWSPVTIGSGLSFTSGVLISSASGGGGGQPLDGDLTSLSNASATNSLYFRKMPDDWQPVVLSTGLRFTGDGVLSVTGFQPLDGDLTSLASLTQAGLYYKQGENNWSQVTISTGLSFNTNGELKVIGEIITYRTGATVFSIGVSDINTHYVNSGLTQVTFNLPIAYSGRGPYSFTVDDDDGIKIQAISGNVIRMGPNSITTGNGFVSSTSVGSSLTLIALNSLTWQAKSIIGNWSVS